MSAPDGLPHVTDGTLGELLGAPRSVLILTRQGCGACAAYEADLLARKARGQLAGVAIGKLVLDAPGAPQFKRANAWLAAVTALPYTVLYAHGRAHNGFATSKGAYLVERLAEAHAAAGREGTTAPLDG